MIDCSRTENYFKEKARMLKSSDNYICTISCTGCPFSTTNNGVYVDCRRFEVLHIEKAVAIVQKWSNEHPQKRYSDDFFNKFPNAGKVDGRPNVCREKVYGVKCNHRGLIGCVNCWNEPMPDEKEGE